MSRILRELVGAREPAFSLRIRQLEAATGKRTVDVGLTGDVLSRTSAKIKQLKLDPLDTTNEELYAMLMQKAAHDSAVLWQTYRNKPEKILEKLNAKAPVAHLPVVKSAVLRKLMNSVPPKKVMAAMGFRSIASMIKRADIEQIIAGAFLLENMTWHRAFSKKLKSLKPGDITMERPKAILVCEQVQKRAGRHTRPVYIQSAGIIAILAPTTSDTDMLLTAAHAAEGLFHVHVRGVLLKLQRFNEDFCKTLAKLTYTAPAYVASVNKIGISWLALYMSINGQKHILAQLDEALVEPSDFFWRMPGQAMPFVHSSLEFWEDSDLLGRPTTYRPISFNISDIASEAHNLVPLSHSVSGALARTATAELLSRYVRLDPHYETSLRKLGIIE